MSTPLPINGSFKATLCKFTSDCQDMTATKNISQTSRCFKDICCEEKKKVEQKCELGGAGGTMGCTLGTDTCSKTEFCGKDALCCGRRLCEGTYMLPMHDLSILTEMHFLSCSNTDQCVASQEKYPNTYCSKVDGAGASKFCCPVPNSEIMRSAGSVLYPPKIANLVGKKDAVKQMAQIDGPFGEKCEKNSDCKEGQFCDKVVLVNSTHEGNIKELKEYEPRMCFPKPRCAGVAYANPDGLGVEFCTKGSSACSYNNAFCDTDTYNEASGPFGNMGVCCVYDCTKEAAAYDDNADKTLPSYATLTANGNKCNYDSDCQFEDKGAKCITAKDNETTLVEGLSLGKEMKLCCKYHKTADDDQYKCHDDKALRDLENKILRCKDDKICNTEAGRILRDESFWDYECVNGGYCCRRQACKNFPWIYMKHENDCKEGKDCLKEEEDKTTKVDSRAICVDYYVGMEKKNKKCCPLDDRDKVLPYCTKRKCTGLTDCMEAQYCHPTKKTCCILGATKLDGTYQENTTACRSTCEDRVIFGVSVAQYCVRSSSDSETGSCYLNPYVLVKERERKVNPVYKTILIVSIILCLVFAFLAMIMFVNYRSKNFCDKYTPKKKKGKGKGKKGKKDKDESGTKSSEVSGTTGGGTTGGGTTGGTKDATGTSGTGATDNVSGAGA